MHVLIEASEAYRNVTGIGRFSRGLLAHLPAEITVSFSPADYAQRHHQQGTRRLWQRGLNLAAHLRLTQLDPVFTARIHKPDLIHSLSFFTPLLVPHIPRVTTIFDLAYFDIPTATDRFWGAYGRRMMPHFARRAAAIVTLSETSRRRIIDQFSRSPDDVHCIYAGVDAQFRPVTNAEHLQQVREKYQLWNPFILYVGAWHSHKNIPLLLEAFRGIKGVDLALTGQPHTPAQHRLIMQAANTANTVHCLGFVEDGDLPALYTLAQALVLPSRYEGFGMPVLEAMRCGTPVIASDIPVLREITGGNALFFSLEDAPVAHLRTQLERIHNDIALRKQLRDQAYNHALQFSWSQTIADLVKVWRSVI